MDLRILLLSNLGTTHLIVEGIYRLLNMLDIFIGIDI